VCWSKIDLIYMAANSNDRLIKAVNLLTEGIESSNNLKKVILRGILSGVATAIGATIVAGIVLWVLYQFISALDFVPFVEDFIDQTPLKALLLEQQAK